MAAPHGLHVRIESVNQFSGHGGMSRSQQAAGLLGNAFELDNLATLQRRLNCYYIFCLSETINGNPQTHRAGKPVAANSVGE